jgi:hypothetical protein
MHPHIPPEKPTLSVLQGPNGLLGLITSEGQSHTFPIHGRAETTLSNALLHIASGLSAIRISDHFTNHFDALSSCPCCKLEGRILSGLGRRKVSEADRLIASRAHTGGKVEVRHIRVNLSGAQLKAYESAYAKRTTPHPTNIVKRVNKRIEDLI